MYARITKTTGKTTTRRFKITGKTITRGLKRLHDSIERQEERCGKLLECLTKENYPGNLDIFLQESVINLVGEFIYKPGQVTFEAYFRSYASISEKDWGKK